MAIELATKYADSVDEMFTAESKLPLVTNKDYDFVGAHTVKIYKVSTADIQDYDRDGSEGGSRYGTVQSLDVTTQECILSRDRSFTFAIDKLDEDETVGALQAATALARQIRERVIPEVDTYVYAKMCEGAGTKPTAKVLQASEIYVDILKASEALDNAEVPETGRFLIVSPNTYIYMKMTDQITLETELGQNMRLMGVVGYVDGAAVIRVPASRLPEDFGFLMGHPSATLTPVKLESFKIHDDPPGISGSLVEGRVVYDCFVLDNKAKALYYQTTA